MAQQIQQGNIFGRIGSGLGAGIGQGLAEQVPKEIERNRLASGLRSFEQEHQNLSPMQQLARLSAIPGISPQTIQSFSELAKQQNTRNAYARTGPSADQNTASPRSSPDLSEMKFADALDRQQKAFRGGQGQGQFNQGRNQPQPSQQVSPEGVIGEIAPANPTLPENLPYRPYTQAEKDAAIRQDLSKGFTDEQAQQRQLERDRERSEASQVNQQTLTQLESAREKVTKDFNNKLEQKLQKSGNQVFNDLSGDYINQLQKNVEDEIASNPNTTPQKAIDKWTSVGLRAAENKTRASKLLRTTGIENFTKGSSEINKLLEIGQTMRELGASKDLFQLLQEEGEMSPQGAAVYAYQPSEKIREYISNFKGTPKISIGGARFGIGLNKVTPEQTSRKAAIELGKIMDGDDSLLAIAREMSLKYPDFDQTAFFAQMSEDKDALQLNTRQRDEISEGPKDIAPSWGDVLFTKSKSLVGKK